MQIKTTVRYYLIPVKISSVQFSYSVVSDFVTPMTAAHQASLYITNSQSLPKLISIESLMPSNHLILCCPLSFCLKSFSASGSFQMSKFFTSGDQNIGVSASTSSPSNEYSRLISYRMDWLDLIALQGTLKSLLQQNSSKASITWRSAFFIVQLSHPYMTTGKNCSFDEMVGTGVVAVQC